MKKVALIAVLFTACANPIQRSPYDPMRVAVLDINIGSVTKTAIGVGAEPTPVVGDKELRSIMEDQLLKNNITLVDDSEVAEIKRRMDRGNQTGIHTTATDLREYQPAATHGIVFSVEEDFSILTMFTLGIFPGMANATARLIDLRTGEVRASVQARTIDNLWVFASDMAIKRTIRKLADRIADTLHVIQREGRHRRQGDWPTPYQQDTTDPSAQGRYIHAIYLTMSGDDDGALDTLESAVSMDSTYAAMARHAQEFNSLRQSERFRKIVGKH